MSIRDTLKATVARCVPLGAQLATFKGASATATATGAQQNRANPHGTRVSSATGTATGAQQVLKRGATFDDSGQKLRVAFASTRNAQLSSVVAQRLAKELIESAMRRCDQFNDSDAAREAMRQQCLDTPDHLKRDLLGHFRDEPLPPATEEHSAKLTNGKFC